MNHTVTNPMNLTPAPARTGRPAACTRALLCAALAASCSDAPAGSAPGPDGGVPPGGPLYAITTTVFGPDGDTTYLLTIPELGRDVQPDYARAIAIQGFAAGYGRHGTGYIYVGRDETPEITRYGLGPDGSLVPGPKLSLAALGIKSAGQYPGYVQFVSDTKAYFLDVFEMRVVVWNPRDMTVVSSFDLPVEPVNNLKPWGGNSFALRPDGRLLLGIHWFDYDSVKGRDRVGVVEIDTATDRVVGLHMDSRCGDNYTVTVAANGTSYFSGGPWMEVARRRLGEGFGARPCHLRIVPPAGTWDASYFVDLSTLTGGRPTGEFTLVGDGIGFVRVFDETVAPPFMGDLSAHADTPSYTWWRWRLGEASATPVPDQAPGVSGGLRFDVDGRVFVTKSTTDYATTTLQRLDWNQGVVDGITLRGYPYGVVRLR